MPLESASLWGKGERILDETLSREWHIVRLDLQPLASLSIGNFHMYDNFCTLLANYGLASSQSRPHHPRT